jgi:hypothetical protein
MNEWNCPVPSFPRVHILVGSQAFAPYSSYHHNFQGMLVKCLALFYILYIYNNPMKQLLSLSLFYRWENCISK